MQKKIVVCFGTDRSPNVRIRLSLIVLDADGNEASEKYHSFNVSPVHDPEEVRADIETHLAMPSANNGIAFAPWPPIPNEEWAKVLDVLDVWQPMSKQFRAEKRAERLRARAAKPSQP
jgi:hypothetical protein